MQRQEKRQQYKLAGISVSSCAHKTESRRYKCWRRIDWVFVEEDGSPEDIKYLLAED